MERNCIVDTKNERGRGRTLLATIILFAVSLLAMPLLAQTAAAQQPNSISGCRSDPIVKFNNGKQTALQAQIFDTSTDVTGVTYLLHIPTGVAMTGLTYTGGAFAGKEKVTVYADNPSNTYTTTITVQTNKTSINVTDTITLAKSSNGSKIATKSVTGLSAQNIKLQVTG